MEPAPWEGGGALGGVAGWGSGSALRLTLPCSLGRRSRAALVPALLLLLRPWWVWGWSLPLGRAVMPSGVWLGGAAVARCACPCPAALGGGGARRQAPPCSSSPVPCGAEGWSRSPSAVPCWGGGVERGPRLAGAVRGVGLGGRCPAARSAPPRRSPGGRGGEVPSCGVGPRLPPSPDGGKGRELVRLCANA